MDDGREFHRTQVEQLVARRDALPSASHVRAAITDDLLNQLRGKIEARPTSLTSIMASGQWSSDSSSPRTTMQSVSLTMILIWFFLQLRPHAVNLSRAS